MPSVSRTERELTKDQVPDAMRWTFRSVRLKEEGLSSFPARSIILGVVMPRGHRRAALGEGPRSWRGWGQAFRACRVHMAMEFQPGDELRDGRYAVLRRLPPAGDKTAYLGHDRCEVTIDVFSSNDLIMPDGLSVAGWETHVLGRLGNHPNIAIVVDHWDVNKKAAIMVSRFFTDGKPLDILKSACESGENLPVERILPIACTFLATRRRVDALPRRRAGKAMNGEVLCQARPAV